MTLKKSSKQTVPYAIILKDSNGNLVEREKMDGTISNAPHRSNEPATSGDARLDKAPTSHDTITSLDNNANIQQNIVRDKGSEENNQLICGRMQNKPIFILTEAGVRPIIEAILIIQGLLLLALLKGTWQYAYKASTTSSYVHFLITVFYFSFLIIVSSLQL